MIDRRRRDRMIALSVFAVCGSLMLGVAYAQSQRVIPQGLTFYGFPARGWQQSCPRDIPMQTLRSF